MICHPLKVSVLSACLSQAFLLPPSFSIDETNLIESLVSQDFGPADRWLVEMDYPLIPEGLNPMSDIRPIPTKSILELNFTVQQQKDTDQLMLNELPIFSVMSESQEIIEPLTIPHRVEKEDKTWEYASLADLGYLVTALPTPSNLRHQEVEEIAIKVDLFKMTDQFFDKIQTIDLQLLSIPSGKLMIQIPQTDKPSFQTFNNKDHKEKCTSFLCKAEMSLSNVFSKAKGALKPCHKAAQLQEHGHGNSTPHPHKSHASHKSQPPHNPHNLTHHPHPNGLQGFPVQKKKDSFFFNTILPYLGPEIVAVLIGAAAALAAMLLGYVAIYTWAFLRQRKVNRYTLIRQSDVEDKEIDASNKVLTSSERLLSPYDMAEEFNEKYAH